MRKLTIFVLSVFFMLATFLPLARAADKLGYVNLSRLFDEYTKTKEYDKVLEEQQKAFENERDKKVNEIKQIQDKLSLLSEKEKNLKKQELEDKVKALEEFDKAKTQDLRKERDEKMKEILKDLETAIETYAKKEAFTMVFNDRVLVYQEKSLDITDNVMKILQSYATKK